MVQVTPVKHFHGWALFEDAAIWRLATTSYSRQRCTRLLDRKLTQPFWMAASDRMVRQCPHVTSDCPYWFGEEYSV